MPATEDSVREVLREVIDPELGVNIVDLGLVYRIDIAGAHVHVEMTMTSPACPLGEYLRDAVDTAVKHALPDIAHTEVELVWHPPWSPDMMSDAARRELGGPWSPADRGDTMR
jgi:metal-sulfur cluster biosynthetic enzyme